MSIVTSSARKQIYSDDMAWMPDHLVRVYLEVIRGGLLPETAEGSDVLMEKVRKIETKLNSE